MTRLSNWTPLATPWQGFAIDEANGQGNGGNIVKRMAIFITTSRPLTETLEKNHQRYMIVISSIMEDKVWEYSFQTSFRGCHVQEQEICWTYMGIHLVWVYPPPRSLATTRHMTCKALETLPWLLILEMKAWARLYFLHFLEVQYIKTFCFLFETTSLMYDMSKTNKSPSFIVSLFVPANVGCPCHRQNCRMQKM